MCEYKKPEVYAEEDSTWKDTKVWNAKNAVVVYNGVGKRFRIILEQNAEPGFGLQRCEEHAAEGVNVGELDDSHFAADFCERVGQFLSLNDLNHLIPALSAYRNAWEAERLICLEESNRVIEELRNEN